MPISDLSTLFNNGMGGFASVQAGQQLAQQDQQQQQAAQMQQQLLQKHI